MNSHIRTRVGVFIAACSGLALMACLLAPGLKADTWDKTTFLTFNEPTQVMNTYLEPGTYMFKLANSQSDRHIVQIFNENRSHLYGTVLAIPAYHVAPVSKTVVTFWETPPGTVKAVRDWFYPGDDFGQEFSYPTQLRQVAALTPPAFAVPAPAPPPPAPQPEAVAPQPTEIIPPPEADQQTATEQPTAAEQQSAPEQQEPVEIAQNNPPPAPPPIQTPPPALPDQQQSPSQSLPQTASPYPMIGIAGILSLGLYLALRARPVR
jgi:hypothetical protein